MKEILKGYTAVVEMNQRFGKGLALDPSQHEFWEAAKKQARLILEEAKELLEAVEVGDLENIMKETSDVNVTNFGMVDLLDKAGFDIGKALLKVCDNNMSKATDNYSLAMDTMQYYEDRGLDVYLENVVVGNTIWYSVKTVEGDKFLKPLNYVKTDLKECLPK